MHPILFSTNYETLLERILAGAAVFPAVGEAVCAAPGQGCHWNGVPCRVSAVARLADATVLATDERFPSRAPWRAAWRELARQASIARTWGDCYGYLLVASGRAEVMVDPVLSPWDAAPLQPIIEEAGGVFSNWYGRREGLVSDAIATNRALAAEVRRILGAAD